MNHPTSSRHVFRHADKLLPMEQIDGLVRAIRSRAEFEIPPSGEPFRPIEKTMRNRRPLIGLGDITLGISRSTDYYGPDVLPPSDGDAAGCLAGDKLLCMYLRVTDDAFTYQIEKGMREAAYPDFMRYLQSDAFVEDLEKLLMEFSDDFCSRQ